jgi:hypothetical protein
MGPMMMLLMMTWETRNCQTWTLWLAAAEITQQVKQTLNVKDEQMYFYDRDKNFRIIM